MSHNQFEELVLPHKSGGLFIRRDGNDHYWGIKDESGNVEWEVVSRDIFTLLLNWPAKRRMIQGAKENEPNIRREAKERAAARRS